MRRAAALALACLLAPALWGQELARFTCERPRPWDRGSLRNVSVAASILDGTVLAPGESFSFNQAMRRGDGLFVEGISFMEGREVRSQGGGICQASSALYNAVLLAGMQVIQRAPHSLYDATQAYVPQGRDAMVARHGSDFVFRNVTAAPLTLAARASGGRLTLRLLGQQRSQRKRWVETELLEQLPSRAVEKTDPSLAPGERRLLRKGFDGLTVRSSLCWREDEGETRCAPLAEDRYRRVDSLWLVGPAPAPRGRLARRAR